MAITALFCRSNTQTWFNLPSAIGLVFHHAYLVYDAKGNLYMASNPVPLKLVK